jgi:hypothetical protein
MANLRKRITGVDEIMDDFALPANELDPVLKTGTMSLLY